MNRKDFIKSLIVGSVILPTLTVASEKSHVIPSVVNPDADAFYIRGSKITIDWEYNGGLWGSAHCGVPMLIETGRTVTINGINISEIKSLSDAMRNHPREKTFLIGDAEKGLLVTGCIEHLDFFDQEVTCVIRYTKL